MEGTNNGLAGQRCAVVTGANKGIGLQICHQLAVNGVLVVLTARDEKKGLQAARKLQEHGLSDVVFHRLDVIDPASIASLAKFIEIKFGKLDILVNNAGVGGLFVDRKLLEAFKVRGGALTDENAHQLEGIIQQNYEMTEECLKTNYYGTVLVTEALLPLLELSQSARIVNLSSFYGQMKFINNEKVKMQLENDESLTMEKLDEIVQWFLRDFKEGQLLENGWPLTVSAYKISKAAINAYTRLLARKFPRFRVNCVHPGLVKTDMTGNTGSLTPEEGARAPVMLALLPDSGPSGLYFSEMDVSSF
ncbi:hypothetical protein GH714_032944 [Hevea brasiliensis]|uniref:Short-chain dehydrogenase/reductase n=1 Tax=Hevea brasiliensis TaxID=3981 RepID=A0A6A6L3B9_HEVBR|nr:hypothetical protein GH714_032944 [Hevea brasiliensis]